MKHLVKKKLLCKNMFSKQNSTGINLITLKDISAIHFLQCLECKIIIWHEEHNSLHYRPAEFLFSLF